MPVDWDTLWCVVINLLSNESTPAWVQAIGSLLGLAIAIYVSKSPIRHAAKARRETIFAIAEAAHSRIEDIREAVATMDWKKSNQYVIFKVYRKPVIDGIVRALQGVPMHELGTSKGVLALLSFTNQLVFLESALEDLLAGPYKNPDFSQLMDSIEANNYKERQNHVEAAYVGLKINVTNLLDQIDKDYEALEASIRS